MLPVIKKKLKTASLNHVFFFISPLSHSECLFFFFVLSQTADFYTMPTSDGPSHFPVFVAPLHANHQRPPGYVPGRVAPVRLPPPAKAPPPLPVKPHGPPPVHRATFSLSEDSRGKERARSLQQRRNTYICVGTSIAAFFVALILILSLRSGDVFDGECKLFSSCNC